MQKQKQKFLIFLHIQKTGGITIQRMLRQKYGPSLLTRSLNVMNGNAQPLPLEEALKSRKMSDHYFAGHICFGVHRLLPQPYHYITLLREPVDRIISLYGFSKSNPGAFYHSIANKRSLEEFSLEVDLPELDNGQTRFIAGDENDLFINRTPIGQCGSNLLEAAKENMRNHFSFVGFTEQFDRSMLLLGEIMGWQSCQYLRLNSSSNKPEVSESLKAKIAARNGIDMDLYSYAQKSFSSTLEEYGIDDRKLKTFQEKNRQLNALFSKPYGFYHQTKSLLRGQAHRP